MTGSYLERQLPFQVAAEEKRCSGCNQIKPISSYTLDSAELDGHFHRCIPCNAAANARYYKRERARLLAKQHARRAAFWQRLQDFTGQQWLELCEQYGNRCLCCGEVKPLTVDHVVPLSQGGTNHISNIQPLCKKCNRAKWYRFIDYRPKEPENGPTASGIIVQIKITGLGR
jgi:hypothetical protein